MHVSVQELTAEAFAPYGTFVSTREGHSEESVSFLPDRLPHFLGAPALDSLSTLCIRPRPLQLTVTEYHEDCEEVFGGYAMEVLFHVGLLGADGRPDLETIAVFRLPAGTYCRVKRRVLHHAPFVPEGAVGFGIVLLPPAAYTVDCRVLPFGEPIDIVV